MALSPRQISRTVLALLVLAAIAFVVDGVHLLRQQRLNQRITAGPLPADGADAPVQVRFAHAHALAAAGQPEPALQRYRALQTDPSVGQAARFNGANVLMRQAVGVRAGPQPGQAIALIELAKEAYRDVLRADPQHWAARYNLERAQRLLADPDESVDEAPPDGRRDAERSVTTMRGYAPGLP